MLPLELSMDLPLDLKGEYLEKYVVLNMKMGNGKLGRIEDWNS
jgi:hypothetical protein